MIVEQKDIDRFWKNVEKNNDGGCWEWKGYKDKDGYGNLSVGNYPRKAHRFVYEVAHGLVPDGMLVCHSCDNPGCVNPNHLFLGSVDDNTQDMICKGRKVTCRGEQNGQSKLSEEDIINIRKLYATGRYTFVGLGKKYSVTKSNIECIVNYKSWKHVRI